MSTLALNQTLADRIDQYQTALANIHEAYTILQSAQHMLDNAFGNRAGENGFSDYPVLPGASYRSVEENLKTVTTNLKRLAWKHIINLSGIRKILSIKRAEELDKRLDKGELDDITHETVIGMLDMLRTSASDYAEEAVKEVYDWLRPGVYSGNKYKTNQQNGRWLLGKKIIQSQIITSGIGSPFQVSYYHQHNLRALDRVFHMLDGAGIPEGYLSPLIDQINTSKTGIGETDYFRWKAFHNGNLHLEFKKLDLVRQINQIAGGGYILPD